VARIRTIKPEFWQDEKLVGLPDVTRLLFLGLVSLADDAGRLLDKPVKIEADLFDGEQDRRREVVESLANLSRIGVIRRGFTASGQRIIEITNWKRHQRVDHPNYAASFPEIVTPYEDTPIREAFANHSREIREALASHTNDLRPVPTTSTSTNDLFSGVADAPPAPQIVRAPRPRNGPQFPHFSRDRCDAMHATWVSTRGAVEYGRFRKTIGPLFTIAEADRPPEAPTDAELADALRSFAEMAGIGAESRFATIDRAAQCLAEIARTRRRFATDPIARSDAVMRIIHGKAAA